MTDQGKALMAMSARIAAGLAANPANTGISAPSLAVEAWDVAQCLFQLASMHRDKPYQDAGKPKGEVKPCTATL